jgi:hypothetical protein
MILTFLPDINQESQHAILRLKDLRDLSIGYLMDTSLDGVPVGDLTEGEHVEPRRVGGLLYGAGNDRSKDGAGLVGLLDSFEHAESTLQGGDKVLKDVASTNPSKYGHRDIQGQQNAKVGGRTVY